MAEITNMDLRGYKVSESDSGFALIIECSDTRVLIERSNVKITKQANEHTRAMVTGLISRDTYETFALRVTAQMDIKITYHVEDEEVYLFQGVIQRLEVDTQGLGANIVYELELEALSYTCLMDIENKSRSFQDGSMTYDEMLLKIMADYNQPAFLNYAAEGQSLGSFTMQYKETDWEFLRRMASRFYVPLLADHKSGGPRFSVGLSEGSTVVRLEDSEYKVIKEEENYREVVHNHNALLSEIDFIYYEVRTMGPDMESLQVGDMVLFQDRLFYIISVQSEVKDYILSHIYRLGTKNGLFCHPVFNEAIGGLSVLGTVMKVSRNMLKVHLDIDALQAEVHAHWFQYATFYATWYCMPEIGDRVNVHFPTVEESEGIVLNSVRNSGVSSSSGSGSSPSYSGQASGSNQAFAAAANEQQNFNLEALAGDEKVKMIATDSGKMLILDDRSGSVSIVCSDGTYVKLSNKGGVSIITDEKITLAGKNIQINAAETFSVKAVEQILFTCGGSSMEFTPEHVLIDGTDILLGE